MLGMLDINIYKFGNIMNIYLNVYLYEQCLNIYK